MEGGEDPWAVRRSEVQQTMDAARDGWLLAAASCDGDLPCDLSVCLNCKGHVTARSKFSVNVTATCTNGHEYDPSVRVNKDQESKLRSSWRSVKPRCGVLTFRVEQQQQAIHLYSKPGCDAWIENLRWKGNDHVKYVFETHPSEDNDRTSLTAYFQITSKDGQVVKRPRQWTKDFVDCEPDWHDHVQFGALIRARLL
ncbi:hypothetical protein EHS25_005455 [Saitozyma podzolica]|uniref:Uncharacterized protein n=1 Tax=Saitozyma podzolica TaxID=1890683 RepID=A0A427XYC4_9TREE|nr:hypothetical protein EHS25_005455 [Saitozyma podzolica]